MTKRTLFLHTLTLALVLLGTTTARADLIQWGFNWTATPAAVTAGGGKITLSNEAYHTAAGDSNIVATALRVVSSATAGAPDTFGPGQGHYSLRLDLKDLATNSSGFLLFFGQMQGNFSGTSANVTNTFTGPTTQSIGLGDTYFTVTLSYFTPPGPPTATNYGSIGAFVHVQSAGQLTQTPEPSSMVLAGIGLGLAGLLGWRRRRRQRAV